MANPTPAPGTDTLTPERAKQLKEHFTLASLEAKTRLMAHFNEFGTEPEKALIRALATGK